MRYYTHVAMSPMLGNYYFLILNHKFWFFFVLKNRKPLVPFFFLNFKLKEATNFGFFNFETFPLPNESIILWLDNM
jgi:hypothetical protein